MRLPEDRIVAGFAEDVVIAEAAADEVVTGPGVDDVVAAVGEDGVGGVRALEQAAVGDAGRGSSMTL